MKSLRNKQENMKKLWKNSIISEDNTLNLKLKKKK